MAREYDPKEIESKWQKEWEQAGIYHAQDSSKKPKYYSLIEFPYPSGDGLHVGHPRPYIGLDVVSRKRRMQGYNVLYPIGWDAFGLPTENYAIKTGRHPAEITKENTDTFRRQIQSLGISFDWSREINTTDPKYYKWTQWIFLKLLENNSAYKAKIPVNWCPKDKIVLANEEVVDGRCERCGTPVEQREKEQWMLAITKYADKLLEGLDKVDYPERVKIQQRNWIGKKEGINITYHIEGSDKTVTCFTTRPDTNFGATFVVIGPEHSLIEDSEIDLDKNQEVQKYVQTSKDLKDIDRLAEGRKKTGIFTGLYCINDLNGYRMPIYVADYVLGNVGTGAVVGVPAHDKRDFEFAQAFNLPVIRVVQKDINDNVPITTLEQVQEEEGIMVNSDFLNGLDIHDATQKIMDYMEKKGYGKRVVNFKLRDWIFSRQRYWGEPIPVVHCPHCAEASRGKENAGWVPVPEEDLTVTLPEVEHYQPTDTGESPLANISKWVETSCPKCGGPAKRETDVMPNWAGSSWYFLRYTDPENDKALADKKKLDYWMPVDWYNGGMEHTVLHLLYSRFWNKFLHDIGAVPVDEPYKKRTSHGLILAEGGEKMSKSKGNVINPDSIVEKFGADTLRLYEMFMGPFEQAIRWNDSSLTGPRRFLEKVWRLRFKIQDLGFRNESLTHKTIKKVSDDIEALGFNTAVSTLMIFANELDKKEKISKQEYETLLKLLAPFAPHISEELWHELEHKNSIHEEAWPEYDETKLVSDTVTIVVQINGKVRSKFTAPADASEKEILEKTQSLPEIQKWTGDKTVQKYIYVPRKLVNIVVS